jgi:AcrR family transcriptional regulator
MKNNEAPTQGKNGTSKAGKTPPSKRGMRTRSRILEAALVVFEREGLVEATMQSIGKEAGLSSGSVYRYFADKSEIFAFLLGQLKKEIHEEASFPVDEHGKLVVRAAVLHYFELYRQHSSLYRVWWESLEPPGEFSEAWVETHDTYRREFAKAFKQGEAQGVTAPGLDLGLAAELAVLLFERPTFTRLVLGWDEDTDDDQTAALIEALLGSGFGPQVLSDDAS